MFNDLKQKKKTQMQTILLAGGTGYLGKHILSELLGRGFKTKIIVRNENKIDTSLIENDNLNIIKAEITHPKSIKGSCANVDVVISTVGITKQKDGLSYMDVDYHANLNLLNEAKKQGVKKFIYISVLNGEKLKDLAICSAKEKFVEELKKSGMEYCIIRPNGFFSDMTAYYDMAKNGRIYLFGNGKLKTNPVHGEDLAKECVNQISKDEIELKVGGPETITQNTVADIAFKAVNKKPKITYIPDWIRILMLKLGKLFMSKFSYGPVEFVMTVMAIEMVAPEYGKHTLEEYFEQLNKAHSQYKKPNIRTEIES
jgi:uncharacterized protein YbjT (DUF2867 family)